MSTDLSRKKLYQHITLWGNGREAQKGGGVCIHIADSLYYTAETSPL